LGEKLLLGKEKGGKILQVEFHFMFTLQMANLMIYFWSFIIIIFEDKDIN